MCPDLVQAWVSWAQFEKRAQQGSLGDHLQRCRSVLQRGLTLNPNNAKLCQVCWCVHQDALLHAGLGFTPNDAKLWQAYACHFAISAFALALLAEPHQNDARLCHIHVCTFFQMRCITG